MKNYIIVILMWSLVPCNYINGQNTVTSDPGAKKIQPISIQSDTIINIGLDKEDRIISPENPTVYSITSYKNVDFIKTDPFQLEAAGLHPEIYISNTHHGVIIISSAEPNDVLNRFRNTLALNPNYYETLTRQDTVIFSPGSTGNHGFDFTEVSSISHDYKNAFNYKADPRTGVSWSKGTHKDFLQDDILGKAVYDLIIVISRTPVK